MGMLFNLWFNHNVYATVISNNFVGLNNKHVGNMKSSNKERCRAGF